MPLRTNRAPTSLRRRAGTHGHRCESEHDARATVARPLRDDFPAVGFCDLSHDREAEPGAGHASRGPRAVEAVEDVREVLVGDTGPVVADGNLAVTDLDPDLGAGRAPLGRVVEEVRDRA